MLPPTDKIARKSNTGNTVPYCPNPDPATKPFNYFDRDCKSCHRDSIHNKGWKDLGTDFNPNPPITSSSLKDPARLSTTIIHSSPGNRSRSTSGPSPGQQFRGRIHHRGGQIFSLDELESRIEGIYEMIYTPTIYFGLVAD
jgi:hypothetical protein